MPTRTVFNNVTKLVCADTTAKQRNTPVVVEVIVVNLVTKAVQQICGAELLKMDIVACDTTEYENGT